MCPSSGETTVFMVETDTRQSSTQNNKYQGSHKHSCFSWWWARSRPKHVEIHKYTKNKLCTKLALFTRIYRDARSTKHKTTHNITEYAITNEWKLNSKDHTHMKDRWWWNTHKIDTHYPKHLWMYVTPCMFVIFCTMILATTCFSISQYKTKVTKSMEIMLSVTPLQEWNIKTHLL
jgi:hypothetical protein